MIKNEIKYLVLSDIHLGHNRNKTENILHNIEEFFLNYHNDIYNVDIIFLAGDIFDKQLSTKSEDYILSMNWLSKLLMYCKTYKIKLRILNGTPSHDQDQVEAFASIVSRITTDVDFKYINILDIEYINDLDIHILYVPDEWRHDANITFKEVEKLLEENHIEKVDIGIMHGCFKYQIPMIKDQLFVHDELNYLNIVKYYINIGHIHTSSSYSRILAQGSFDRLSHGEEEAKGGIICKIFKTGEMEFKFLENKLAMTFKTIDCIGKTETDIFKILNSEAKTLRNGSHVRVLIHNENKLLTTAKNIFKQYPSIVIKFKLEENKKEEHIKLFKDNNFAGVEITKFNILELFKSRGLQIGLDEIKLEQIINKFKTFI